MASQVRAVVGAVKSALQAMNGTGAYTYDLSGTSRVRIGVPDLTSSFYPRAYVALDNLVSTHGPQLGRYKRTALINVWAFCASTSSDTEERGLVATDLLDEICTALETDRTLGMRVLDIIIQGATFDGDEEGIPGAAVAVAQVEVYWHANSAAGV